MKWRDLGSDARIDRCRNLIETVQAYLGIGPARGRALFYPTAIPTPGDGSAIVRTADTAPGMAARVLHEVASVTDLDRNDLHRDAQAHGFPLEVREDMHDHLCKQALALGMRPPQFEDDQ